MDGVRVPNTQYKLVDGTIVILSRFPKTEWQVKNGVYQYQYTQYFGWFFESIPMQTVIPLNARDLANLAVVSGGVTVADNGGCGCDCGTNGGNSIPTPTPPTIPPLCPCPPKPNHSCPPPFPPSSANHPTCCACPPEPPKTACHCPPKPVEPPPCSCNCNPYDGGGYPTPEPVQHHCIEQYVSGMHYTKVLGQLVFINPGELYQVIRDFRAATEATLVESLARDVFLGNLAPLREPLPPAADGTIYRFVVDC